MKKFSFGREEIIFGNDQELCVQICNFFWEEADKVLEKVHQRLEANNSISNLLKTAPDIAQQYIDQALERGVEAYLLPNKIYDYDVQRIKAEHNFINFKNNEFYKELCDNFDSICELQEQHERQKQIVRAYRSRWQGGGFGISGAIKGSIKAGAMNMVTDAFRGIGDSIGDASDRNKFSTAKENLNNSETIEQLNFEIFSSIRVGAWCIVDVLEKERNFDGSCVLRPNKQKTRSLLSNIEKISDIKEKQHIFKNLIETDPIDYLIWEALVASYETLEVSVSELREIAAFIGEVTCFQDEIDDKLEKYLGETLTNVDQKLISRRDAYQYIGEKALELGYVNEEKIVEKEPANMNAMEQMLTLAMAYFELDANFDNAGGVVRAIETASFEEIEQIREDIIDIGRKNRIMGDEAIGIAGAYKKSVQCSFYEMLDSVFSKLNYQVKQARTADGIEFVSAEEANIYREEIVRYKKHYEASSSYADYESKKMYAVINNLRAENFKTECLLEDINKLEQKAEVLKKHEQTTEFARGKRILEEFSSIENSKIILYGSEFFLKKALEARIVFLDTEKEIYPIVFLDEENEKYEIKGIAITEKYLYDSSALFGLKTKSIQLDNIKQLLYDTQKKIVEVNTKEGKRIKISVAKWMDVETFSKALSVALDIMPPCQKNEVISVREVKQIEQKNKIEKSGKKQEKINVSNPKISLGQVGIAALIFIGSTIIGIGFFGPFGILIGIIAAYIYFSKAMKKTDVRSTVDSQVENYSDKEVEEKKDGNEAYVFCTKCGAKVNVTDVFCDKCGAKLL